MVWKVSEFRPVQKTELLTLQLIRDFLEYSVSNFGKILINHLIFYCSRIFVQEINILRKERGKLFFAVLTSLLAGSFSRSFFNSTKRSLEPQATRLAAQPGRSNISRPLISLRMMQNIYQKCTEMPSRGAIGCCSNIPDLKKIYYTI